MSNKESMDTLIVNYFTNLFSESNGDYSSVVGLVEPVASLMVIIVSNCDNDSLLAPFSTDVFRRAVFQIHSNKAPAQGSRS